MQANGYENLNFGNRSSLQHAFSVWKMPSIEVVPSIIGVTGDICWQESTGKYFVYSKDSFWELVALDSSRRLLHPIDNNYVFHIRHNHHPNWVKAASVSTMEGHERKKRKAEEALPSHPRPIPGISSQGPLPLQHDCPTLLGTEFPSDARKISLDHHGYSCYKRIVDPNLPVGELRTAQVSDSFV
jgi:hypothetical protein